MNKNITYKIPGERIYSPLDLEEKIGPPLQEKGNEKLVSWMLKVFPAFWAGEVFVFLLFFLFGGKWEKVYDKGADDIVWQFLPDTKVFLGAIIVSFIMVLSIIFSAYSMSKPKK